MASTYATFTPGTSTNNNKFTMSVWVKRTKITGDYQAIYVSHISGGGGAGLGLFIGNDNSVWYNSGTSSSAFQNTSTSAKLRDLSGWYHIVVAGDTTQSGTDKLKIWINNKLQTSFGNDNRSSFAGLSYDLGNATYANQLGRKHDGTYYLEGVLSHFHFIDGTAYTPSTFGSTDSTTGEWKINTNPSVTYGNNGFFLFKDDNSLNDDSGEGNNFTLGGGTLTKTEDCPSNVFATYNPLDIKAGDNNTYVNGNNTLQVQTSGGAGSRSTLAVTSGKYYAEFKHNTTGSDWTGVAPYERPAEDANTSSESVLIYSNTGSGWTAYVNGVNQGSGGIKNSYASGEILMLALDMDNDLLYVGVNGGWYNGTDCSGTSPSNGFSLTANRTYAFKTLSGSTQTNVNANFGNGYFGTTAVASAGTNASGNGIFEYNVPTGYTALSTKGLNL